MIAQKTRLTRPLLVAAAVLALSVSLGGCISLLPKEKPAQLYRFGAARADAGAVDTRPRGVVLGQIEFPREATTDGILTVKGTETAYIAGVRWVAPAVVLFRQAVPAAFDEPSSRTRVLSRGEIGAAAGVLQLEVAKFEADYTSSGAPTISVMIRARLSRADGALIGERNFDVERPAGDNRVSAIVPAFDAAVREALGQVVQWTDASLDANPPPPPSVSSVSTSLTTTRTTTTTHR